MARGRSELDRAILTGESQPVLAKPGDVVTAGETNLTGPLTPFSYVFTYADAIGCDLKAALQ